MDSVDHFVVGMDDIKRHHLGDLAAAADALAHFQKAVILAPVASPLYHYELGHAAWHRNAKKESLDAAAAIESLWPESPERNFAVGRMLLMADNPRALDRLERAAWNPPRAVAARQFIITWVSQTTSRADLRARLADLAEETVEENPSASSALFALGTSQLSLQRYEDAIRTFQKMIRLDPTHPDGHVFLAQTLGMVRDYEGELAAAREAVRVAPDDVRGWNLVGSSLTNLGRPEEAVKPFERALEIEPSYAPPLCNFGSTLLLLGDFDRALALLQKGHAIGSRRPDWRMPSGKWLADATRLVGLEKRRREVREGTTDPPGPDERVAIAWEVCQRKKLFAEATAYYTGAFEDEPAFLAQPEPDYLMEAAACALAAGLGQGADAPADPAERKALRERARAWLSAGLESGAAATRSAAPLAPGIKARLKEWGKNRVLAGARSGESLRDSPPEEAAAWRSLFETYDSLLRER